MSYHVLYLILYIQSYTVYIYIYTIPLGKQKKTKTVGFWTRFPSHHTIYVLTISLWSHIAPPQKSSGHRTTKPLARRMVVTSCFKSDTFTIGKGWSTYHIYILCIYLLIIYIYTYTYTITYYKNKNKKHCWVSWDFIGFVTG